MKNRQYFLALVVVAVVLLGIRFLDRTWSRNESVTKTEIVAVGTSDPRAGVPTRSTTQSPGTPAQAPSPGVQPTTAALHSLPVVPVAVPDARPAIISVSLSPAVARAGQTVSGTVITSSNVAGVAARIGGYSAEFTKMAAGQFRLSYQVPSLPREFRGTYAVDITARNTRGDKTSAQTSITIH